MNIKCFFGIHTPIPSDDLFYNFECEKCGFVSPEIERQGIAKNNELFMPPTLTIADLIIEDLHTRKARK